MTILIIYLLLGTPLFLISLSIGFVLCGIEYHGWMHRGHNNFWMLLISIPLAVIASAIMGLCWPIVVGFYVHHKFTNEMDDRVL
jgi:hypothetical protein